MLELQSSPGQARHADDLVDGQQLAQVVPLRGRQMTTVGVQRPAMNDVERPIRLLLSRLIGESRDRQLQQTRLLCQALALYGRERLPDHCEGSPPHPLVPTGPWPAAPGTLRRLGVTQRALREKFERREHECGAAAELDLVVLEALVPRLLWPVLATLMEDGPGKAQQRAGRALRTYSQIPLAATRRLPAGTPGPKSVEMLRCGFHRVFRLLNHLALLHPAEEALRTWTRMPTVHSPVIAPRKLDTEGPTLDLIRIVLRDLDLLVATRLGIELGSDELEALRRMTKTELVRSGLFKPLRARATLGLLVVTGARVHALAALSRVDYGRRYHGPAPDCFVGAALMLRPAKTLHEDEVRVKLIPAGLAARIDAYLSALDRCAATLAEWAGRPLPVLDEREIPLLVAGREGYRPWGVDGIRLLVAGKPPPTGRVQKGTKPLIARRRGVNPEAPRELRQYYGYNPHSYRHTTSYLAERAGELWNERNPAFGGTLQYPPALYASSLLDHAPREDVLRSRYGDRDTDIVRELLAGRATHGIWELIATDLGARKKPDVEQYRSTLEIHRAIEATIAETDERMERASKAPAAASAEQLSRRLLDIADLNSSRSRLAERRDTCSVRLRALREDRSTWLVVPDDAPPGVEDIDLDMLDRDQCDPVIAQPLEPVRDWLITKEFAELAGCRACSTVTRWINEDHRAFRREDRPWGPGPVPVDDSLGVRFRRIPVAGIQKSFWRTQRMRDRLVEMLSTWPDGQGWRVAGGPGPRCFQPLQVPDPSGSVAADE